MKMIADQLALISAPVPEQEMVMHVLTGLWREYEPFVTAITTRSDHISLPSLQGLPLTAASRKKEILHPLLTSPLNTQVLI